MIDLSTVEARKQLVSKYAGKWALDVPLVCALIEHESSWNPWAFRPEPEFEKRYVDPMKLNLTETIGRSCSWGLMQIMGQTATELGFGGRFHNALCDPGVGVDYGCRKLARCFTINPPAKDADGKLDYSKGLLAYNGGSDPTYPKLVMQFYQKYGGTN